MVGSKLLDIFILLQMDDLLDSSESLLLRERCKIRYAVNVTRVSSVLIESSPTWNTDVLGQRERASLSHGRCWVLPVWLGTASL